MSLLIEVYLRDNRKVIFDLADQADYDIEHMIRDAENVGYMRIEVEFGASRPDFTYYVPWDAITTIAVPKERPSQEPPDAGE